MGLLNRLALVLVSAYILAFFSEYFFLNEEPALGLLEAGRAGPVALALGLLELVLWYALPAYLMLVVISLFRVRTPWALVLAGALYGFVVEGAIVWQLYEGLPFTIGWTALGWHVLLDVLLGWYWVQRVLQQRVPWRTAVLATALGLYWGVWATWYGVEQPLMRPAEFAPFALATGGLWVLAHFGLSCLLNHGFEPTRVEVWGLMLLLVALFFVQIVLIIPFALLVLPPLIAITLFALWRNRRVERRKNVVSALRGQVKVRDAALLLLTPLVAAATYPLYYHLAIDFYLADLLVPVLMLAGFVVYGVALWKAAWSTQSH